MKPEDGIHIGDTYRQWAAANSQVERDRRRETIARLPSTIFDAHAHANGLAAVGEISDFGWTQARSSFPTWSMEDSNSARKTLYYDRNVARLWIAQPYKGIDHKRANEYLLTERPPSDAVALCGVPDDQAYTVGQLATGNYAALKMYPFMREPPFTQISEYFPSWACEAASAAGTPIVLHLPVPLDECWPDVVDLAKTHPSLKIILAHMGRTWRDNTETRHAFRQVAEIDRIAMDTSMANNPAIHEIGLQTLGRRRILFGSDEPFNLLRYVTIDDSRLGKVHAPPRPYHWSPPDAYRRFQTQAVAAETLHFQVLNAILAAVDCTFAEDVPSVLADVFYQNAQNWFAVAGTERGPRS
jgi:Amidohydrolase